MQRKGLKKEPKIIIHGDLKSNQFAFCHIRINGGKYLKNVTDCSKSKLISFAERHEKNVKSIDVKIINVYDKIVY